MHTWPHVPRRTFFTAALLAGSVAGLSSAAWGQETARTEYLYEGVLGNSTIGMTLLQPRSGDARLTGHYFHGKALKDIALTGTLQGHQLVLREPGGATFALQLVGQGQESGKPPAFASSVGLSGVWTQGARRLDVTLGNTASRAAGGRRYAQVTSESDAEFEARVQAFHRAVLAGQRAEALRFVDFPLRVSQGGKTREIASAEQLEAGWTQVFTRACLDLLKEALPHDMFVANGQAMLGSGAVWFGANGAVAINLP
ncbi:MAG: hypothetical protein EOO24_53575 [Comamonadaceae bacterium]|nr:MAG: hypothetical protein EOO24_53575 [Comamonadaceae bacterium]